LRAIVRGAYVKNRVFFRDEATAVAAGYRPCAVCLPEKYAAWKVLQVPKPTNHGGRNWSPFARDEAGNIAKPN
jgi:hypothetical protein